DRWVMGQHERVARSLEALLREIERRDDGRTIVGHEVLGVVLDDRIGVRVNRHAGSLERGPPLLQLALVPFRPRPDQRLDLAAAASGERTQRPARLPEWNQDLVRTIHRQPGKSLRLWRILLAFPLVGDRRFMSRMRLILAILVCLAAMPRSADAQPATGILTG